MRVPVRRLGPVPGRGLLVTDVRVALAAGVRVHRFVPSWVGCGIAVLVAARLDCDVEHCGTPSSHLCPGTGHVTPGECAVTPRGRHAVVPVPSLDLGVTPCGSGVTHPRLRPLVD
jgi:hypothetical protein